MAIRARAKSGSSAGDSDSARLPSVPLSAGGLQLDHASASVHWYAQLRALEASFDFDPRGKQLTEKQAEIERIEEAVSHIRFPLTFSDQLYGSRSHIDIVRRKISSHTNAPGRMAAE